MFERRRGTPRVGYDQLKDSAREVVPARRALLLLTPSIQKICLHTRK